jgi:hypothetical protein
MANIAQFQPPVNPANLRFRSRGARQDSIRLSLLTIEIELTEISKSATARQSQLIRNRLLPAIAELKRCLHHSNILPLLHDGAAEELNQ